jgi:hypothetical protein
MSTITPRTVTFWREGWTATVLMMSAATRNSSPSRMLRRRRFGRSVALLATLTPDQGEPGTDEGCREAQDKGHDPKHLDASRDGVHRLLKAHAVLPRPINARSLERREPP